MATTRIKVQAPRELKAAPEIYRPSQDCTILQICYHILINNVQLKKWAYAIKGHTPSARSWKGSDFSNKNK